MGEYAKVLEVSFILILLGLSVSVNLQDVVESSGEPDTSETSTPYSLIDPDSSGDGISDIGNAGVKVDIVSDISEQDLFDNETLTLVVHSVELGNNNDSFNTTYRETTTSPGIVTETTSVITEIKTTTQETTTSVLTTEAPSTTTTNILLETTEMKTTTETTTPEQETSTKKATTVSPVTSTRSPTTRLTTIPKLWRTSTKVSVLSTTSATTESDSGVQACTFIEEDFICDLEIDCFGNGIVDCIDVEDETESTTIGLPQVAIDVMEYEDEDVDSDELTARIHAIRRPSFLWKIHSMSTESSEPSTLKNIHHPSTATEVTDAPSTMSQTSTNSMSHADPEVTTSDTASSSSNHAQTTIETMTPEDITTRKMEQNFTVLDIGISDNSQTFDPMAKDKSSDPLKTPSSVAEDLTRDSTTQNYSSTEVLPTEDEEMLPETTVTVSTTLGKPDGQSSRRKRSDDQMNPPKADTRMKSSESFHSSKPNKGINVARTCRIIGNLQCMPLPSTGFCKGRGTCKVPVEKTEKSTSEKKVENWAIIVIAICATAAALTVSLLIYLVISSWKKLKVQPQNGVTTLTYVNNTPP